jgi:hypothetical protein
LVHSFLIKCVSTIYPYPSSLQSYILLLRLLALRPLLLHPLTSRRLPRQLLNLAVPIALRIAVLARSFHRVDAVGFVGLRGDVPGFGAGDCADGGLCGKWLLVYEGEWLEE